MFIFPEENNTGLPPVSISPLFSHSFFEGYRYFCKTQSYAMQSNWLCLMKQNKNVDFKSFVVWVKRMSD